MTFKCISFKDLSLDELYLVMQLRQEVFIVEQNCPFMDADGKDPKAWHCLGFDEAGQLVAYTRLFDLGDYYEGFTSIGRVVTSPKARGTGLGKILIQQSIDYCTELFGKYPIKIGAQKYLEKFYETFGFKSTCEDYIEDGIMHTIMIRP
jgi:ElaA protein